MFFPSALRATFPENWPDAIKERSAPSIEIALTPQDVTVLGHFNAFYMRHFEYSGHRTLSDQTTLAIKTALKKMPHGVMPRLGLCSWKGTTLVHAPAKSFGDVMRIITQSDLRIGRALASSAVAGEGAVLHLREWVDIPEWAEFRIFVRNGRVVGISQYFHQRSYSQITENIAQINQALFAFAAKTVPDLSLDTVVMDVHFRQSRADILSFSDIAVVELNPFSEGADPCLFSWDDPAGFDGRLRFRT